MAVISAGYMVSRFALEKRYSVITKSHTKGSIMKDGLASEVFLENANIELAQPLGKTTNIYQTELSLFY